MGRPKGSKNGIRKLFTITCASCGKEFQVEPYQLKHAKTCSRECQAEWHSKTMKKPTNRICPVCGIEFITRPRSRQIYCSMLCASKEHGKKISGERNPNKVEHVIKTCRICNMEFDSRPTEHKQFCSKECASKSFEKPPIVLKCQACHQTFTTKYRKTQKYCSRACRTAGIGMSYTTIELAMASALFDAGIRFDPQYNYFHYVLDFAIPESKIAIECDGIYWHSRPEAIERDRNKDEYLKRHKWTMLRFTETEIYSDINLCIARISEQLAKSPQIPLHFQNLPVADD